VGTAHISVTDAPLITTSFLNLFDNSTANFLTLDPKNALFQLVAASDEFLIRLVNGTRTGILASGVTYPEFKVLPTPAIPITPWEVHVAPVTKYVSLLRRLVYWFNLTLFQGMLHQVGATLFDP
jgi:platelet-activating factor acetylhydrolase